MKKFYKNKLLNKELHLLGDYMFFYYSKLFNKNFITIIKNCKGLKYILRRGYIEFQKKIVKFINKCKSFEHKSLYIKQTFYNVDIKKYCKFISGLFVEQIFLILKIQQQKIDILLGNLKTLVKKKEFLFNPTKKKDIFLSQKYVFVRYEAVDI